MNLPEILEFKRSDYNRIFTFGDIHGCLTEIKILIEKLEDDYNIADDDVLIFLGDYIDRGEDSKGVVDYLLKLPHNKIFLKGNHEDMFSAFMGLPGSGSEFFMCNGGEKTLKDYGLNDLDIHDLKRKFYSKDLLRDQIGDKHIEFYKNLYDIVLTDKYAFLHAGVDVQAPFDNQDVGDLLWNRSSVRHQYEVIDDEPDKVIIHGHTPNPEVFVDLPYEINVDTGCIFDGMFLSKTERGKMSCLIIENDDIMKVVQVTKGDHIFNEYIIED